ncbi:hypothetical protein QR680_013210 [Steinernema hermaphroditum]|uniref:Uncharacterized protein n=1 Tax=Steinernema hermaphroditum TaxID=289476 RepID=A0AA39M237_9BILA|nr:hypothetical protein QR680_013210 [Steinernema hermaphroditum]
MSTLPGSFCAAKENNLRRKRQRGKIESLIEFLGESIVKMLIRRGRYYSNLDVPRSPDSDDQSQQHYGDSFLGSQQKRLSSPHRIASLRNDRPLNSQYSSPSLLDSLRQQKAKVDRNWSFHAKNKQRDDAMLLSQCAGRSNVILTSSGSLISS